MASDREISSAILQSVQHLFKTDRDGTTVNKVRRMAEEKLGLEDGFLKGSDWKGRSKDIITEEVERLDEEPELATPAPATKPAPKSKATSAKKAVKAQPEKKRGTKRAAPSKAPPKKRQKKDISPSLEDEELSELDSEEEISFQDSDESERKAKKTAIGRGRVAAKKGTKYDTESEDESELSSMSTPSQTDSDVPKASELKKAAKAKAASKPAPKRAVKGSRKSAETIDTEDDDADSKSPAKRKSTEASKTIDSVVELRDDDEKPDMSKPAAEDTDSDLSVLIDEPPRRKSITKASKSASSKPATSRSSKSTTALSPEEAEIKTLQSQLVKCGIRKIWQFELKGYGDDSRAKIQHLKRMLREAGMEGRFSEAKAKEIKEMRELQEDLEVVQEGAKRWGKGGRRSEAKKVASGNGSGREEESEEESEEEARPVARRAARAKADLAFLGNESESD